MKRCILLPLSFLVLLLISLIFWVIFIFPYEAGYWTERRWHDLCDLWRAAARGWEE